MKTYMIATKLKEAPIGDGKREYDIDIKVDEESLSPASAIGAIKRQFTFPVLQVPMGSYFAELTIEGQYYAWDIRVGCDPSAPTRLMIRETRMVQDSTS